mmetsp:Transcript_14871/g.40939  ORF Transcript_14871/g.40939 Transcript_14871/m.40939 type:complete len:227 (+) Transcript_14871:442-1122(+)
MCPLLSASQFFSCTKIVSLTKLTAASSCSAFPTAVTTSQSTPMSMFITVKADNKTNTKNTATAKCVLTCPLLNILVRMIPVLSMKVPSISSVHMQRGNVPKEYLMLPTSPTSINMMMLKMYTSMPTIIKEDATARDASAMPFIIVTSSGIDLIIRAILVRRSSRKSLRGAKPTPEEKFPEMCTTGAKIHVSTTIITSKQASNLNQLSVQQFHLRANAPKRTNNSKV